MNGLAAGFSVKVFFGGALTTPSEVPVPVPLSTTEGAAFWIGLVTITPPPAATLLVLLLTELFMTETLLLLCCTTAEGTTCGGEVVVGCCCCWGRG